MSTEIAERSEEKVKPERVPADTAAELERVKQLIGHQFGIDTRSPGQVAQAEKDEADAQKQLEEEQRKEAEEAAKAAKAEADESEAPTRVSRSR